MVSFVHLSDCAASAYRLSVKNINEGKVTIWNAVCLEIIHLIANDCVASFLFRFVAVLYTWPVEAWF